MKVGDTPGDRFEIRRLAAESGAARVFEAWDRVVEQTVLLQAVSLPPVDESRYRNAVKTTVAAVQALRHPAICKVFDYGLEPGCAYLVAECVAGRDLAGYVARQPGGRLSRSALARVAGDLVGAVRHLHDLRVVHGGLTPASLVILPAGSARIVDLGLSLLRRACELPAPAGSAPELAGGRPPGTAADIFGIGTLVYFMLGGKMPAGRALQPADLDPLSDLKPAMRNFLRRCLDADPRKRPHSVHALAGEPRGPRTPWRSAVDGILARPAAVARLLVVLACLLIGFAVWLRTSAPPRPGAAVITVPQAAANPAPPPVDAPSEPQPQDPNEVKP
jgi:serine/threonine-protein kinase